MGSRLVFDCSLTDQYKNSKSPKQNRHCGPKNILIIEGSKEDRQLSENNTALLERVWILSRPPQNLKDPQPTVSARRVQIVRAILDGEFNDDFQPVQNACSEGGGGSSGGGSSKSASIVGGA